MIHLFPAFKNGHSLTNSSRQTGRRRPPDHREHLVDRHMGFHAPAASVEHCGAHMDANARTHKQQEQGEKWVRLTRSVSLHSAVCKRSQCLPVNPCKHTHTHSCNTILTHREVDISTHFNTPHILMCISSLASVAPGELTHSRVKSICWPPSEAENKIRT